MNRDRIRSCITDLGFDARLAEDGSRLIVEFVAQGRTVTLTHTFSNELLRLPTFYLLDEHGFGKLAHVLTSEDGEPGEVCIADPSSTAVNTDRPELAYRDTVEEHVRLLTRLIDDPAYNRDEQLREFDAHWKILCRESGEKLNELFVAWDGDGVEGLQLMLPRRTNSGSDLRTRPIAMASTLVNDSRLASVRSSAGWNTRQVLTKAIAVPLNDLEPAPAAQRDLLPWYFRLVNHMDNTGGRTIQKLHKKRSREFWLVFSAPVPDGKTLFAIHWHTSSKCRLPTSTAEAEAGGWTATPYAVRSLSQKSLVPRGGGSLDLVCQSVLLVGCGSVGSDLALRLTSAGVGRLTVSDPDKLSEENLYRHILSLDDIGRLKAEALANEITLKHPWAQVTHWCKLLEELREPAVLRDFDLIVLAIGSPNIERIFAEYCAQVPIDVPVISCWLEGYGIGGHAILVVPGTKGCWLCAYVDPETITRGLASNLNFLAPGQVMTRNQGGCGTQFLPYSSIAAGYTAAMVADLAVRFLEGQVANSSKVSWKGSDAEARQASLAVTWRYRHFTESLRTLPLHDNNCDFCGA